MPHLKDFNGKRKRLLKNVLHIILDESISGWRLKTSKLGVFLNYTCKPSKPIPLGTMFRNGAEVCSGILCFQDVMTIPYFQYKKDYH